MHLLCTDSSGEQDTLFLEELGPLFAGRRAVDVLLGPHTQTPLQKRVLEYVGKYMAKKKNEGREHVHERLGEAVRAMGGVSAAEESESKQRAREAARALAKAIGRTCSQDADRSMRELEWRFSVEREAFANCLRSCVIRSMDVLLEADDTSVLETARRLRDHALSTVADYAAVVRSQCRLVWGSSSSFDTMDIVLSRPIVSVLATFEPGPQVRGIQGQLEDVLLLRTRSDMFHMTVFQASLTFCADQYEPESLPVNTLGELRAYLDEELAMRVLRLSRSWYVCGKHYPSRLVVDLECSSVRKTLARLRKRLGARGYWWMLGLGDELQRRNFRGKAAGGAGGAVLSGDGWKLTIGEIAREDHRMHVTLGVVRTGFAAYDRLLVEASGGFAAGDIDLVFSSGRGDACTNTMAQKQQEMLSTAVAHMLSCIDPDTPQDYSELRSHEERARKGSRPRLGKRAVNEWHGLRTAEVRAEHREVDFGDEGTYMRITGLKAMSSTRVACRVSSLLSLGRRQERRLLAVGAELHYRHTLKTPWELSVWFSRLSRKESDTLSRVRHRDILSGDPCHGWLDKHSSAFCIAEL